MVREEGKERRAGNGRGAVRVISVNYRLMTQAAPSPTEIFFVAWMF